MDRLFSEKFRIVSITDYSVWIGADNKDNCAVKQVITGGQMKDWSFKDDCLVLDDVFYSSREDDKVVVRFGTHDCTKWEIVPEREETYRIRLPGTNKDWTMDLDHPNSHSRPRLSGGTLPPVV
ncbi:hypothetical protein L210DRAFT_2061157 [Boletus edulis BED1]|uniref:Uncharacterized protein n=1 Tax=Boletus edulis BED1 TaxID=1328754 RepID=A0AAD4GML4_BOLED|nr:hypothetical protein L210DRAFT_2061157 [Boletus edulis BED1]